jgi:hypothetical protein
MIRRALLGVVLLAVLTTAQSVTAQTTPIPGLGIKLGDDVAKVKAVLSTDAPLEPMTRSPLLPSNVPDINRGKTVLHLRTKGIWAFFDAGGSLETIRLDAPYTGGVLGVKVGDPAQQVTGRLGNPIKKPSTAFLTMQSYQYALDDTAYVNFDVSDDGVQIILIHR